METKPLITQEEFEKELQKKTTYLNKFLKNTEKEIRDIDRLFTKRYGYLINKPFKYTDVDIDCYGFVTDFYLMHDADQDTVPKFRIIVTFKLFPIGGWDCGDDISAITIWQRAADICFVNMKRVTHDILQDFENGLIDEPFDVIKEFDEQVKDKREELLKLCSQKYIKQQ